MDHDADLQRALEQSLKDNNNNNVGGDNAYAFMTEDEILRQVMEMSKKEM